VTQRVRERQRLSPPKIEGDARGGGGEGDVYDGGAQGVASLGKRRLKLQ